MRFRRSHHRKDYNADEIIEALKKAGFSVHDTSCVGNGFPDLVVGKNGKNCLLEIKDGSKPLSKRALTEDEEAWHCAWNGYAEVVDSPKQALEAARRCCE